MTRATDEYFMSLLHPETCPIYQMVTDPHNALPYCTSDWTRLRAAIEAFRQHRVSLDDCVLLVPHYLLDHLLPKKHAAQFRSDTEALVSRSPVNDDIRKLHKLHSGSLPRTGSPYRGSDEILDAYLHPQNYLHLVKAARQTWRLLSDLAR
ncbi:MAG: hypothetical protein ACOCWQ_02450 [Nanoarchaeota archaeon]